MASKEEFHDPDYPEAPVCVKEEARSFSDEEKVEKIKSIIRREFLNELEIRENEIMLIDERMSTSRRLLQRLRYTLVSSYYNDQKLQLTNGQIQDDIAGQHEPRAKAEASNLLRDSQRRIHPSVRKLLGKESVDIEEIFKTRAPRNKTRKNYCAMLQKRNYTISADTTKTLRPDTKPEPLEEQTPTEDPTKPKKVPRRLDPKITNVLSLNELTRNQVKHRYRIVIGNTSKYAPGASRADRSTHQWLLYVRGAGQPDLSALLRAVRVTLHHSYAPHHTVLLRKPPYHVTRRGWGEFPAKVELHFAWPDRNRAATVEHTIKLDRHYTGMQVLGAETIVDVWLYSTPEMLPFEYKEENDTTLTDGQTNIQTDMQIDTDTIQPQIKTEEPQPTEFLENSEVNNDNWMDFFTKEPAELDVDEMFVKPIKKEPENDIETILNTNVIDSQDNETLNEVTVKNEIDDTVKPTDVKVKNEIEDEMKLDENEIHNVNEIKDLPNEILNKPNLPKKRIVKYIDPTTGKIYYLEMDRTLDLTKVQEIVINNTKTAKISPIKSNGLKTFRKKKSGVSLLKPEVKNMLKNETVKTKISYAHIENDHCYLGTPKNIPIEEVEEKKTLYDCLCSGVARLNNVRSCVNYLIKKIPIISEEAKDTDFLKYFPFVVENEEKYWKMDFAKRRNIEWSRAKLINKILHDHLTTTETIWRTKQILTYARLHGFYPLRSEAINIKSESDQWSSWNDYETNSKTIYPSSSDINTLSIFDIDSFNVSLTDVIDLSDDEDVDVTSEVRKERKESATERAVEGRLCALPVEDQEDRLRFLYLERKCAEIGIELRNEDVGNGCSYSAVHAVLLSAMKSFAEELVRSALAVRLSRDEYSTTVWHGSSTRRYALSAAHAHAAARRCPRARFLTAADTARHQRHTTNL